MHAATRAGWKRAAWLLVLTWVLALSPALATTFEETEAECANCSQTFRAREVTATNTYGGIDADGCRTANGETPWSCLLQVCTHCLATRYPALADQPARGDAAVEFLAQAVKSRTFPVEAEQRDIPTATRFELACGLLGAEGRNPYARATVWQYAAWAARGDARAALLHPEETWSDDVPQRWRALRGARWDASALIDRRAAGARTLAGREVLAAQALFANADDGDAALRHLHLAVVLRCHGELATASTVLAALPEASKPTTKEEQALQDWIETTRSALAEDIATERRFLQRALHAAAEAGAAKAKDLAFDVLWREAECARRLGKDEDAAAWLGRMLAHEEMSDAVLVLLRDAAEWSGNESPTWRDAVHAAWDARIDALVAALGDAEAGESAAERLARIGDPAAFERIVAQLSDEEAGAAAAMALAGYAAPPTDTLASIEKRAADAETDLFTRWNLFDALVAWAEPSSAPVFRAALGETDDDLLEHALRGLGRTGTQADVAAVLTRADDAPESATEALSLLVGRSFETPEAFRTWWKDHATNKALAETALREAGGKFEQLDIGAVPELIGLLVDPALPVRWNAHRALRTITGERFDPRDLLYEGRVPSPESPDLELDLERVLGDGWTVSYRGSISMDLGPVMQPLRDRDGRTVWGRAKARWQHWWEIHRPR